MAYDPAGRLLQYDANGSTRFTYTGGTIATELDAASGAVTRRYVTEPGGGTPLVWYEGAGSADRRFLQADERGSVIALSDAGGQVIGRNAYDEYGIPAPGNAGRFQYTGQTWFPEVGLYNYKARWYSPTLGRFMQTDPIGYGDGLNWYGYVHGDPVNGVDPDGLKMVWACATVEGATSCSWHDDGDVGEPSRRPEGGTPPQVDSSPGRESGSDGEIVVTPKIATPSPPQNDVGLIPIVDEHTKNARPSTQGKHEKGQARRGIDRGGEKGDASRRPPRVRPNGWKGPWPPLRMFPPLIIPDWMLNPCLNGFPGRPDSCGPVIAMGDSDWVG